MVSATWVFFFVSGGYPATLSIDKYMKFLVKKSVVESPRLKLTLCLSVMRNYCNCRDSIVQG